MCPTSSSHPHPRPYPHPSSLPLRTDPLKRCYELQPTPAPSPTPPPTAEPSIPPSPAPTVPIATARSGFEGLADGRFNPLVAIVYGAGKLVSLFCFLEYFSVVLVNTRKLVDKRSHGSLSQIFSTVVRRLMAPLRVAYAPCSSSFRPPRCCAPVQSLNLQTLAYPSPRALRSRLACP